MRHQTYTHTGLPHFRALDSLSLQLENRQADIKFMWDNNEEFMNMDVRNLKSW